MYLHRGHPTLCPLESLAVRGLQRRLKRPPVPQVRHDQMAQELVVQMHYPVQLQTVRELGKFETAHPGERVPALQSHQTHWERVLVH